MKRVRLTLRAKNFLSGCDAVILAYHGITKGINFNFVLNIVAEAGLDLSIADDYSYLFDDLELMVIKCGQDKKVIDLLPEAKHVAIWIAQERLTSDEVKAFYAHREFLDSIK